MIKKEAVLAIVTGKVVKFKGNGRKLGYPTANLETNTKLPDGVYFGFADMINHLNHPTLIFIGTPTTVGDKKRRVEAHLLDIDDQDYYGQELKLYICKFHRSNKTFESVDQLLEAMKLDEAEARRWFTKNA